MAWSDVTPPMGLFCSSCRWPQKASPTRLSSRLTSARSLPCSQHARSRRLSRRPLRRVLALGRGPSHWCFKHAPRPALCSALRSLRLQLCQRVRGRQCSPGSCASMPPPPAFDGLRDGFLSHAGKTKACTPLLRPGVLYVDRAASKVQMRVDGSFAGWNVAREGSEQRRKKRTGMRKKRFDRLVGRYTALCAHLVRYRFASSRAVLMSRTDLHT